MKYVFVCGLHRSGTSVLARNIGGLANCTAFRNTGVIEDEGQHLQSVYPTDVAYGGAGRFGFDPRAHLTERSALLTPKNIASLSASWHVHWDPSKRICVEKTPANLIMTRFLQAAFPHAYFVVLRRHPVPVSIATQRWKVSMNSLQRLFDHWLRCYHVFDEDKQYLEHVFELRYEDYIKHPSKFHREIAGFIGADPPKERMEELTAVRSNKYLDHWLHLLTKSPWRNYYRYLAATYEHRFQKYGYSLMDFGSSNAARMHRFSPPPLWLGSFYCCIAEVAVTISRLSSKSKWYIVRQLRARMPARVAMILKRVLRRAPARELSSHGGRPVV